MDLSDLGWNPVLDSQFEEFRRRGLRPGRIAREEKHNFLVYSEYGELTAELAGRIYHLSSDRDGLPVVGDWVALRPYPVEGKATIEARLPRRSRFSRKVKGTLTREHVIVANVDTVFLVSGLGRELNLRRLERYLTLAWKSGARPVVVLNKTDLSSEVAERTAEVEAVASGVPVHPVCAHKPASLSALGEYLGPGRTVALLGSSGVGKSTLINALLGCQRQFVREIRRTDGRGRHATAFRELVILPGGGMIIDNPGMREIQLWGEERDLGGAFADVEELASRCRFRRCSHESEPGCAVKEALAEGELDPGRYRSYLKLKRELEHLAQKQDEKARQNTKARWKRIAVEARRRKKHESRHE